MLSASVEVELRRAKRYPVKGAVSFSWTLQDGTVREAQGVTLNLSSNGAFVATEADPQVGDEVDVEIYLKSASNEFKLLSLAGKGRVTRRARERPQAGFGAQIVFRTDDPDDYFSNYVQ
jgi:PilZ domain